jgi:hypothetical protein
VPTIIDMGVARPNAHGQAIINTETAATTAYDRLPKIIQTTNAKIATTITAGTT